ncbi:MAG: 50S ribosomal protein L2 [Deltaproteobacteria bacterium]|jgi:large subunit ribosomal protein L2|nr:50S ribosomal protein L2 [Deltaproteobacteria bacterium]
MGVRTLNPTTPGARGRIAPDFSELSQGNRPLKALTAAKPSSGGRNHFGRITSRFRGGGHKRRFRTIDFRRDKIGVPAKVASIEYDPNRSARIALLNYADGEKRYILWPVGLKVGDTVLSSRGADIKPGNSLPLRAIPLGTTIHNVALHVAGRAQLVRSAGDGAQLMAKEGDWGQVRLPSGEVRVVHLDCRATIGQLGNIEHSSVHVGKAGRTRWLGRRPHNRGVTMNPVDHPMGGGEGRSSGGRHPCSPWGQLTKGLKTRQNKRTDRMIIKHRGRKA